VGFCVGKNRLAMIDTAENTGLCVGVLLCKFKLFSGADPFLK